MGRKPKLSGAALTEFNDKHPRGAGGKFVRKGSAAQALTAAATPQAGAGRGRKGSAAEAIAAAGARLRAATNVAEADAAMSGLTVPQLKGLAAESGVVLRASRTKEQIKQSIRLQTVVAPLILAAPSTEAPSSWMARARPGAMWNRPEDIAKPVKTVAPRPRSERVGAPASAAAQPTTDRGRRLTRPDVTREEVQEAMRGLSVPQLRELASELGPTVLARGNKEQLRWAILEGTVGFRERARAIFGGTAGEGEFGRRFDAMPQGLRQRIGDALEKIRQGFPEGSPQRDPDTAWIHLSDLRAALPDVSREALDQELKAVIRDRGRLVAIPQSNQKVLTGQQRDAALRLGGEDKHLIRLLPTGRAEMTSSGQPSAVTPPTPVAPSADRSARAALREPRAPRATGISAESLAEIDAIVANPVPDDREKLRNLFSAMTLKQLNKWAAGRGIARDTSGPKAQQVGRLVEHTIGFRLNSQAIRYGGWQNDGRDRVGGNPPGSSAGDRPALSNRWNAPETRTLTGSERRAARERAIQEDRERAVSLGTPRLSDDEMDGRIAAAYSALSGRDNELVSLVRLRAELADVPTDEINAALKRLDRGRAIQLSPDPNQKALPDLAHIAALPVGGTDNHFISVRSEGVSRLGANSTTPSRRSAADALRAAAR